MKPFINSQSNIAIFEFDQSLSFPTAAQGNDGSGNEIEGEMGTKKNQRAKSGFEEERAQR